MSKREPTPGWTRCGVTDKRSYATIDGIHIWDHERTRLDEPVFVTNPMDTSGEILRCVRYEVTAQGKTVVFAICEMSAAGGYQICVPDAAVHTVKGPRW